MWLASLVSQYWSREETSPFTGSCQSTAPAQEIILSGRVTGETETMLIIDEKYIRAKEGLDYRLKVGRRVQYHLLKEGNDHIGVTKVTFLDESSDNSGGGIVDLPEKAVREEASDTRIVNCRVYKKIGNTLSLTTENREMYDVDMDDVSINFVPKKGDAVSCEIYMTGSEEGDFFGESIKMKAVKPRRIKTLIGKVTFYRPSVGTGIIEEEIPFDVAACSKGYEPRVGDQIKAQIIESQQGTLVWRAVEVQPIKFHSGRGMDSDALPQEDQLFMPKNGVHVTLLTRILDMSLNTTMNLQVEVKNSDSEWHTIDDYKLMKSGIEGRISRVEGLRVPLKLGPEDRIVLSLLAKACSFGKSSEQFILSFDKHKFSVGCKIELNVEHDAEPERISNAVAEKSERGYRRFERRCILPDPDALICPGIQPIKPPRFIPVQCGTYNVPKGLYTALLDENQVPRAYADADARLKDFCPAYQEALCEENYTEKFHTLLYLEEINIILGLNRLNQNEAIFNRRGDYQVLTIPNLTESRPSLVIGDRVHASNPQVTSTRFEGYIHKTTQNEIWLRFGSLFDDLARDNVFAVTFQHSRSNFVNNHQAIDNICKKNRLGIDWLFPSSLKGRKTPQVIFRCEDQDEDAEGQLTISRPKYNTESVDGEKSKPSREELLMRVLGKTSHLPSSNPELETDARQKTSSMVAAYHHIQQSYKLNKSKSKDTIKFVSSGRGYGSSASIEINPEPCKVQVKEKVIWFNPNLNYRQRSAVKNILRGKCRPLPYVVHGPPGTGKTITVVEAILQIYSLIPDSRILIATPSNSAADLLMERLLRNLAISSDELVRLVSFSYWNDGRIPTSLKPYAAIAELNEQTQNPDTTYRFDIKNQTRDALCTYRITISTCSASGILYNLGFPPGHFTHVFVDEAGQATEPEILIPLSFLNERNGQAILTGDPMQLGPVVTSELAKPQLNQSLLYRLISNFHYARNPEKHPHTRGLDPDFITMLLDNYRSLPQLLYFTSTVFYDGELVPHMTARHSAEESILRKLSKSFPPSFEDDRIAPAMVFCGIKGENQQERDSPSWFNLQEIQKVIYYLKDIYEAEITKDDVGIITPYQQQAAKIRRSIRDKRLPMPKVGSVEEFQGQERRIIIISVVRSREEDINMDIQSSLGFLRSPFRVNVATSRARALLIVIGNPSLIGRDAYWRKVIEYAATIGGYTGCSYPDFLTFPEAKGKKELTFEDD